MPYGEDLYTEKLQLVANEIFEREVLIYPVATGSAANALALATVSPPYGQVFCHAQSHIEEDECAAPEFYIGGGKLSLLEGENAKFSATSLRDRLENHSPAPAVHRAQPAARGSPPNPCGSARRSSGSPGRVRFHLRGG